MGAFRLENRRNPFRDRDHLLKPKKATRTTQTGILLSSCNELYEIKRINPLCYRPERGENRYTFNGLRLRLSYSRFEFSLLTAACPFRASRISKPYFYDIVKLGPI